MSRAPMPLVLAIAPNGAITGGFPTRFEEEQLLGAFATPGTQKVIKSLQEGKLVSDVDRAVFEESRIRIQSMAMVHEKMYQSEGVERVPMKEYLGDLAAGLLELYPNDDVALNLEGVQIELDLVRAVPCALAIFEACANALKHGIAGRGRARVTIRLESASGRASISVVHKATTRDGRRVAVKVLRPGIERRVATDLDLFQPLDELEAAVRKAGLGAEQVQRLFASVYAEIDANRPPDFPPAPRLLRPVLGDVLAALQANPPGKPKIGSN